MPRIYSFKLFSLFLLFLSKDIYRAQAAPTKKLTTYINPTVETQFILLCNALISNDTGDVKAMLNFNNSLATTDIKCHGIPTLSLATECDNHEILESFVKHGADINQYFPTGNNPLLLAVQKFKPISLTTLLRLGANCDVTLKGTRTTGLHIAASGNAIEAAKHLISGGCKLEQVDENGHTPLQLAVIEGFFDMCDFLISHNVNARGCLSLAINARHQNVIESLLQNKRANKILHQEIITIYLHALRHSDYAVLELLFRERPFLLRYKSSSQSEPILYAAMNNDSVLIQLVAQAGGDLNIETIDGFTAIELAINNENLSTIEALIDAGAQLEMPGREPLLARAAKANSIDIVKLLVKKVSDINGQTQQGYSALDIAKLLKYREIEKILLEHGALNSPKLCAEHKEQKKEEQKEPQKEQCNNVEYVLLSTLDWFSNWIIIFLAGYTVLYTLKVQQEKQRKITEKLQNEQQQKAQEAAKLIADEQARQLVAQNNKKLLIQSQLAFLCNELKNQLTLSKDNSTNIFTLNFSRLGQLKLGAISPDNSDFQTQYQIPNAILFATVLSELNQFFGADRVLGLDARYQITINLQNPTDLQVDKSIEKLASLVKKSLYDHCKEACEYRVEKVTQALMYDLSFGRFKDLAQYSKHILAPLKIQYDLAVQTAEETNSRIPQMLDGLSLQAASQNSRTKGPLENLTTHLHPLNSYLFPFSILTKQETVLQAKKEEIFAYLADIAPETKNATHLENLQFLIQEQVDIKLELDAQIEEFKKKIRIFNYGLDEAITRLKNAVRLHHKDVAKEAQKQIVRSKI